MLSKDPDKPILSEDNLRNFMRWKPTLKDTAAWFRVSDRTIERFIKEHFDLTFVEFRTENMVTTRHDLVRKAIDKALGGDNTMLIFCLKNLCGWSDKQEQEVKATNEAKLVIKFKDA